jgi:cell fate regulator YaaT (PSP1 superfamily)
MFENQREWVRRVNRLVKYMHYEWDKDEKWLEYYASQGTKKKAAPTQETGSNREVDAMKRAYYVTKVDKDFEKALDFKGNEEEKAAYFQYVALFTYFGSSVTSRERSLK